MGYVSQILLSHNIVSARTIVFPHVPEYLLHMMAFIYLKCRQFPVQMIESLFVS